MEDRVIELEALQKALLEGTGYWLDNDIFKFLLHTLFVNPQNTCLLSFAEAYDKLQANIVKARENLTKIFTSKDVKATVRDSTTYNFLLENLKGSKNLLVSLKQLALLRTKMIIFSYTVTGYGGKE